MYLSYPRCCRDFVEEQLGSKYLERTKFEFAIAYQESSPSTPIFFILSPGVDPVTDVEVLGWSTNHTDIYYLVYSRIEEKIGSLELNNTNVEKYFPFSFSGKELGFTSANAKFHNFSLGQGQEMLAEAALDLAAREGHWVVLQVYHS